MIKPDERKFENMLVVALLLPGLVYLFSGPDSAVQFELLAKMLMYGYPAMLICGFSTKWLLRNNPKGYFWAGLVLIVSSILVCFYSVISWEWLKWRSSMTHK